MKRDIRRHLPENGMRRRATDAGKVLPLNDESVKTGSSRFNHELITGCSYLKALIVAMAQRQNRVGINGRAGADEEDGLQHIDYYVGGKSSLTEMFILLLPPLQQ